MGGRNKAKSSLTVEAQQLVSLLCCSNNNKQSTENEQGIGQGSKGSGVPSESYQNKNLKTSCKQQKHCYQTLMALAPSRPMRQRKNR